MKKFIIIIFLSPIFIHNSLFCQTWQYYDSLRAIYQEKFSYDTAFLYAEKALQIVKDLTGGNDTLYANMLRTLVDISYYSDRYENAIEFCMKERDIRKSVQGEMNADYASALNNLASLYDAIGEYQKAEPLYIQAKSIRREVLGERHPDYASSLNDLGQTYWAMGNYAAAESLYIEAMNLRKEILGNKDPDYSLSLNNLAVLYQEMGNYPSAESLLNEAKNINKEVYGEKHPDYALSLNNLAVLYWSMGNYPAALTFYVEAKNINKDILGEKSPEYALSLNNLAVLYQAMGNYIEAEPLLIKAKNIRKEILGEKHPDYATSLHNLAVLYHLTGNYSAAEQLLLESKSIRKEVLGETHPDHATSLYNLALLYQDIGNYPAAESYYLECLETRNKSIVQNFAFLSEKEKELYFKTQAANFEDFYSFSLKRKKEDKTITGIVFNSVIKNKGLLLKSSTAMRTAVLNSNDTALISRYEKWISIRKEISQLYSLEVSKREENPENLEKQANAIEKELVRGSHVFSDFQKMQNISWESVRNSLKPGEAAIEFIHFSYGIKRDTTLYCALLLTSKSKQPEMIQLFYEKELESILESTNGNNLSYIRSIYGTSQATGEQLYKLIWQPLENYLRGIKTVYYSPDGLLHKISFASIGREKDVYLCDTKTLHLLSTTGKLSSYKSFISVKNISAGLYGGIDYSDDSTKEKVWKYLPGTKSETDKIDLIFKAKKLNITYLSGKSATEGSLKKLYAQVAPLQGSGSSNLKPEILHIATHGFFYPDPELLVNEEKKNRTVIQEPLDFRGGVISSGVWQFMRNKNPLMRSGLVFSGANNVWNKNYTSIGDDGVLTAQEVTQLDLQKTPLVVLSACETGLGDIEGSEGVYGLQRAFKMAGVEFLIMSLWQVPDKETSDFMTRFYEKLLVIKEIRRSFNETQMEMRKKYDPFFWAAFVLIE